MRISNLLSFALVGCCAVTSLRAQVPQAFFTVQGNWSTNPGNGAATVIVPYTAGTASGSSWGVQQSGISVQGSISESAISATYSTTAGPSSGSYEQEGISFFVLGPPGTPYRIQYAYSDYSASSFFTDHLANAITSANSFLFNYNLQAGGPGSGYPPSQSVTAGGIASGVTSSDTMTYLGATFSYAMSFSTEDLSFAGSVVGCSGACTASEFSTIRLTLIPCQGIGPCITSPANNASPQSQFAAISGTGTAGDTLNVIVNGAPVGTVVVDSEGNWEALPYVAPFGPSVTIQVQDQTNFDSSNTITVHPLLVSPPGIVGPAISYTQLLPLRKADIFITADPSSAQIWFYGPTYTHTALYLGGDSEGTPWVAEAVTSTEAEANIFGQVRSVPLEHSLAWNGALTMTAFRPAPALALPGATRAAIVAWVQNITIQGLPYGNIASMSTEVLAADALFAIESVTPTPALLTRFNGFLTLLNSAKNSTTSFICSTLVWRAYWEGTGHSLDISTPNNMTAAPGSVLGNLPTPFRSAFINQLGSVFVVPQTFATSPKLSQVF